MRRPRKTPSPRARTQTQADARVTHPARSYFHLVELVWIQRDHSRFFPPDQTNAAGAEALTVACAGAGSERALVFFSLRLPATPDVGFLGII